MSRMQGKVTVTRRAEAPNPAADPARVQILLHKTDINFKLRWITLGVLGFIVLWFGPLLIATIVWISGFRRGGTPGPWTETFLWTSLIVIPLLFLFEHITRGKFFDNTVEGLGDVREFGNYGGAAFHGAYYVRGRLAAGALALDVSLWGPRMLLASFRRIAALSRVKPSDHAPAAHVLATLVRQSEGLPAATVMAQSCPDPDDFSAALAYLCFHEIVGISQDGARLWVLSDARKKLTAAA